MWAQGVQLPAEQPEKPSALQSIWADFPPLQMVSLLPEQLGVVLALHCVPWLQLAPPLGAVRQEKPAPSPLQLTRIRWWPIQKAMVSDPSHFAVVPEHASSGPAHLSVRQVRPSRVQSDSRNSFPL